MRCRIRIIDLKMIVVQEMTKYYNCHSRNCIFGKTMEFYEYFHYHSGFGNMTSIFLFHALQKKWV